MTAAFDAFAEKSGIDTYDRVRLFADTADTVFVPDAVVGDAVPAEWLARMGVHLSPDMKAVRTEAYGGVCALFPVDAGVASWLADRLGHRAAWYSPLHESMAAFRRTEASGDCFVVYPTQENVYISGTARQANCRLRRSIRCTVRPIWSIICRNLPPGSVISPCIFTATGPCVIRIR